jgi:hypothetical protein
MGCCFRDWGLPEGEVKEGRREGGRDGGRVMEWGG